MSLNVQRKLIADFISPKEANSGSFVNNMKLPVHRWFRYSAGFSAEWAQRVILENCEAKKALILDPFAGSATTLLAADSALVSSVGIEAHWFVARIARAKLMWPLKLDQFSDRADRILERALTAKTTSHDYPALMEKCFSPATLMNLYRLREAWAIENDGTPASELIWLAITAILRPTASAGTAQWQYILPNKTKKTVADPFDAFKSQIQMMETDMAFLQHRIGGSLAAIVDGDARRCLKVGDRSVDLVITSPPYANNYDYADATRLEMSFWGEIKGWSDLHQAIRKDLIVSSSQHASLDKLELDKLLSNPLLKPVHSQLSHICRELEVVRTSHGGKKHYHTMIAAYFLAMAEVWQELYRVCKPAAKVWFVIGDSAPYGVYVPVDRLLGELAVAAGFSTYTFTKLRDRNVKWKNRKHRVPLHEGLLWISN